MFRLAWGIDSYFTYLSIPEVLDHSCFGFLGCILNINLLCNIGALSRDFTAGTLLIVITTLYQQLVIRCCAFDNGMGFVIGSWSASMVAETIVKNPSSYDNIAAL